ncbi:MAG: glucose-6-phosphate isomerase [Burkholderiales bacterium]|jgi:glucose-6-phosphate isomerase|nr:glucose-6-phosphate isomerase [Burkholderiales bacterium]
MMNVSERLTRHARIIKDVDLRALFARDPKRGERLWLAFDNWRVDYSRHAVTDETLELLNQYAQTLDLNHWISALFSGERLNFTENRAALHTALRQPNDTPIMVDDKNIVEEIHAVKTTMRKFSEAIRIGLWKGATGKPFKTIVHIGTGGSYLGTRLICDALFQKGNMDVRFVANLDHHALDRALTGVDPESTLLVIASKTFTTEDILVNAKEACNRLAAAVRDVARVHSHHVIAVTANIKAAQDFGIPDKHILPIWPFIGGRFSLWSAVSISLALQSGYPVFEELLSGAHAMDEHVFNTPIEQNIAVQLALLDWWNSTFLARRERVLVPYAHTLGFLPEHVQQLMMESNGKRIDWYGKKLSANAPSTRPIFGGVGTTSQHTFFQWLHQGMHNAMLELIVPIAVNGHAQRIEMPAHALAQAESLMNGSDHLFAATYEPSSEETLRAARVCVGNTPSTVFLLPNLNAYHLGALLALYEHRTFIESILYRVNPFDQFGVELGKNLAPILKSAMMGQIKLDEEDTDSATLTAVDFVKKYWKG